MCQDMRSWGGPSLPLCSSSCLCSWATSLQALWCLYQLSELQPIVLWMLFFNSQNQISWVEDEDTNNSVSGSSLKSHLGSGDRWHVGMWYAVSKILTSTFKQVMIFSGPVTFLWYSLCLTSGLQDILADQLRRDNSNNYKEHLKYLVLQMSCKRQNSLWHALTVNERQYYSKGTGKLGPSYIRLLHTFSFHEDLDSICLWKSWPGSSAVILMAPPYARYF